MRLAKDHAQWFVDMVKPLLVTYFEHGYKHGWDDAQKSPNPLGEKKGGKNVTKRDRE